MRAKKEFNRLYASKQKFHTSSFIYFFVKQTRLQVGFVASKKVGDAVCRNRAKRRLRAMVQKHKQSLAAGLCLFVAKKDINDTSPAELDQQFIVAMRKLHGK